MVIYHQISLFYPISVTNPLRNFPIEGSIFCETKIMVPPPHIKTNYWKCRLFPTPFYRSFMTAPCSSQPIILREPCPRIHVRSGMQLPLVAPLGSHIPLRSQIPGRTFRQDPQPETTSHFSTECWDVVSTETFTGKPHPIPKANSGTQLPQLHPSGNPIPLRTHPGIEQSAY